MPRFFYIARDKTGKKETGFQEASNQEEAVSKLQAKDLLVINISLEYKDSLPESATSITSKARFKPKHYRITSNDLTLFCRQLATLLGAGVTILKSLDVIAQQVASRRLYFVIKDLQKQMEAGLSFHEAMAKHSEVFSELWVNLVESGEASGNLAVILNRLAGYLERNAAFKKAIITALIYPAILLVVGLSALLFLTIKIIPTFAELFKGFNVKLPFLTQMLISFSVFMRASFWIIVVIFGIIIFILKKYIATRMGRRKYEEFLFSLPVFGEFFKVIVVERFTSEMSTLVESGVPILYSLEISERSVNNLILGEIIHVIKEDVREGKSLSSSLVKSGFFDPMIVQMVSIGEEVGELSSMFKKADDFYQENIQTFLQRFTSMFEPMMLIFMGVVIGIMVIGMFLPIFQIAQIGGK